MAYHKALAGVGWVSLIPVSGTYPAPILLETVTGMTIDIEETDVDLVGADIDVLDSFPSSRTVSGTITLSDYSNSMLAALTNGVTVTANRPIGYSYTAAIPTTPFQLTAPVTNPARTFVKDMGIINLTAAKAMVPGAAAAAGVYSLSGGVATFHTDDSGDNVLWNYTATITAVDGTTATIDKPGSGLSAAKYGLHCYKTLAGKSWGIYVPAARIPKLGASFKRDGWSEITLDWKATLDANNHLYYMYAPE
jgi:hypothetical protein